jgi:hypothetical protein
MPQRQTTPHANPFVSRNNNYVWISRAHAAWQEFAPLTPARIDRRAACGIGNLRLGASKQANPADDKFVRMHRSAPPRVVMKIEADERCVSRMPSTGTTTRHPAAVHPANWPSLPTNAPDVPLGATR